MGRNGLWGRGREFLGAIKDSCPLPLNLTFIVSLFILARGNPPMSLDRGDHRGKVPTTTDPTIHPTSNPSGSCSFRASFVLSNDLYMAHAHQDEAHDDMMGTTKIRLKQ